jgi:capsular exopolysaccharide synthesis family protein
VQIDLAQIPSIVARWWLLLVAGLVVGGAAGFVATRSMPMVYQAGVTIQITRSPDAPADDSDRVQTLIRTYAELVRTLPILSQAAARAGIAVPPAQLQGGVNATPIRETQLLRITVEDSDPERVVDFATALVDVLAVRMDEAQASRFSASKTSIGQVIESVRSGIESRELKAAQLRIEPPAPTRDAALALAENELQEARSSYASALKAQADLRLLEARSGEHLTIVEPPQVPEAAIRPSRSRVIMLGTFGGLTVALAVICGAVLLEGLRSRAQPLERLTGLPVLTEVPLNDGSGSDLRAGQVADCYGSLPSRIVAQGIAVRSILVTSAQTVEARSSVAASMAVALAQSGRRVVLVDGNLRQPAQAGLFDLPDGAGLSTLLFSTGKTAQSVLRETAVRGLRILTTGPLPPDPADFLREHSTRERLAELYAVSDVVIVDAPPISAGPDSFLIGLDTDATLLVVDARQAPGDETIGAVSALEACGIRAIGAVLHGVAGGSRPEKVSLRQKKPVQQSIVPGQLQLTPSRGDPWF